ncbi:polysaccharide biosynthesis C-terminal domain-containing protein [Enterococcus termitis]
MALHTAVVSCDVVFKSFQFLGTIYIAAEQTTRILFTTIVGGAANIILNLLLIPFLGGIGAGIGSWLSFFVIWYIRSKDTKKLLNCPLIGRNL